MKTDTTLFEIFADLGITEIMQSADVEEFVSEVAEEGWHYSATTAA